MSISVAAHLSLLSPPGQSTLRMITYSLLLTADALWLYTIGLTCIRYVGLEWVPLLFRVQMHRCFVPGKPNESPARQGLLHLLSPSPRGLAGNINCLWAKAKLAPSICIIFNGSAVEMLVWGAISIPPELNQTNTSAMMQHAVAWEAVPGGTFQVG